MSEQDIQQAIAAGKTALGVEFGSTRIKAVLIGLHDAAAGGYAPLAAGSHEWENRYENGVWTYHLEEVWTGLQAAYRQLAGEVRARYGVPLTTLGALGFSGMMHGYLPFDREDRLLTPFRTWRNTLTEEAAAKLTELFRFNIPQRWSIAHFYQALLNREPHVKDVSHLTTLAGYVHWRLTGEKVLGVGEASGVFPIDSTTLGYDAAMLDGFDGVLAAEGLACRLADLLPEVRTAGEPAGVLTAAGARLIDPTGTLQGGIPLCPPEGDAGTGMVATNAVAERTGNVSAGTSVFAMIVLERALSRVYPEIDLVTTPSGRPVAMVHSNNCTSDLNAWLELFREVAAALGVEVSAGQLFETLYRQALAAEPDGGGLLSYAYLSGEHITHLAEGRPLFVRTPQSRFTLPNFMRTHLFSALGALKIGLDILFEQEHVQIDRLLGHGGFFKTPEVGQRMMAAAANVPVAVMETAGEGGAWGIALLAAYLAEHAAGEPLEDYLARRVFAGQRSTTLAPDPADAAGFATFMARYKAGLPIERAAVAGLIG